MVYGQYGEGTMKRADPIQKAFGIAAARTAAREVAARGAEQSQTAAWFWAGCTALVIWSLSYLIRQPGIATSALVHPFSPVGDFALEGMLLALAWLGMLAAACIAVLTGVARIEER